MTLVHALWMVGLLVVAGLLPVIVYSLHHLRAIARQIERNAADTLTAAGGIAGNTANVAALGATIAQAGRLLEGAAAIDAKAAAIESLLATRAAGLRA